MERLRDLLDNQQAMTYVYAGAAALSVTLFTVWRSSRSRRSSQAVVAPPGTVVLHQIPRGTLAPSLSPFPIKLETFLRLANIPYINDFGYNKSSKEKFPYITYNGEDVADSQLSIEFLKGKLGIDLDKGLSPEQKAVSQALRVMVDEHVYWAFIYFRWVQKDYHQNILKENFRFSAPKMWLIRRKLQSQAYGQGMGRHTSEEVMHFVTSDLKALDGYLGDKDFLMGDHLTEVDCSVFGTLCQFVYIQDDDYLQGLVQSKFPRLLRYTERVKAKVWPDWEEVITKGSKVKKAIQ